MSWLIKAKIREAKCGTNILRFWKWSVFDNHYSITLLESQKFWFGFLSQYWKDENTLRSLKRGYVWCSTNIVLKNESKGLKGDNEKRRRNKKSKLREKRGEIKEGIWTWLCLLKLELRSKYVMNSNLWK